MKKYKVTIWRTAVLTLEVEAEDDSDAIDKASGRSEHLPVDEWSLLDDEDYDVEEEE